ncbi:MAG: hypothetical protein KIT84_02705 [Labilithrix sp.]|nr:hypothetical protein [Labilithrix sp.]MCW5809891.1 hypothetical protein [Labilithrix sp.]
MSWRGFETGVDPLDDVPASSGVEPLDEVLEVDPPSPELDAAPSTSGIAAGSSSPPQPATIPNVATAPRPIIDTSNATRRMFPPCDLGSCLVTGVSPSFRGW